MSLEKYFISNIEISALSRDELFKEIKKNNSKKTLHLHSVNLQHIGLFGKYSKNYHRIRELSRGKRVLNLIDGMPILNILTKNTEKNTNFSLVVTSLRTYFHLSKILKIKNY